MIHVKHSAVLYIPLTIASCLIPFHVEFLSKKLKFPTTARIYRARVKATLIRLVSPRNPTLCLFSKFESKKKSVTI